jgi:hypothetical protein
MNITKCRAAAVAGLALGGILLTACGTPDAAPQPTEPPAATTTVTRTVTRPAPTSRATSTPHPTGAQEIVLGATGYGEFKLGMDKKAALAVGGLTADGSDGTGCTAYQIRGGGRVVISDKYGLVRVQAPAAARTLERIRPGSTIREVKAAYRDAQEFRAGFSAKASSVAHYEMISTAPGNPYRDDDKIDTIRVVLNTYDCALALV